eukprot:4440-Heterococcus_DN1.PRE.1
MLAMLECAMHMTSMSAASTAKRTGSSTSPVVAAHSSMQVMSMVLCRCSLSAKAHSAGATTRDTTVGSNTQQAVGGDKNESPAYL